MNKVLSLVLGVATLVVGAGVVVPKASAQAVTREGLTVQLAVGAGATSFLATGRDTDTWGGVSVPNLQVGGFVTPDLAITVKASALLWSPFRSGDWDLGISGFAGPNAQFWLSNSLSLEVGVGLGLLLANPNENPLVDWDPGPSHATGLGLALAANYFFMTGDSQALGIQAQVQPTITDEGLFLTYQLAVVCQAN